MRPFLPAILLSLLFLAMAPAIGHLRDLLFAVFPGSGVKILAAALGLLALLCFAVAISRIRSRRTTRYLGLLIVFILLVLQTTGFSTNQPKVDIVEKIHILQYGTIALLLYRAVRPRGDLTLVLLPLLGVFLAGTLEEWVQWRFPQRTGEIRDVLLNVFAGFCGLLFAWSLQPPDRFALRLPANSRRSLLRLTAILILALGGFIECAHLGHHIEDEEIGTFRSFFTGPQLLELQKQRQVQWRKAPPTRLPTWSFEDYYLTEAAMHASHRNASLAAGDSYRAWQANRILEKYFDPFLDLDSFRNAKRHRLDEEGRHNLERRSPKKDPRNYLSPVLAKRVWRQSNPWPFRFLYLGLAALCLALSRHSGRNGDGENHPSA